MRNPLSDIIISLKVSGQLMPTELPMCSPWADIIMSWHRKLAVLVHCAAYSFSEQPMCSPLFILNKIRLQSIDKMNNLFVTIAVL